MSPPFVATFWREAADMLEPLVVDGLVIPPGTTVGVNPYSLMHNKEYFDEPFEFRPDRWLTSEDGAAETGESIRARETMRRAFAPFGLGEASCLGKAMAYQEMSLVVAKTLWYFDMSRSPGDQLGEGISRKQEYRLWDIAATGHDGPNLIFRPRKRFIGDSARMIEDR